MMTDAATFATEKPNRRQYTPNKKRLNQIAMVSNGFFWKTLFYDATQRKF